MVDDTRMPQLYIIATAFSFSFLSLALIEPFVIDWLTGRKTPTYLLGSKHQLTN